MNFISAKHMAPELHRQWAEARKAACKAIICSPVSAQDAKDAACVKLHGLKSAIPSL